MSRKSFSPPSWMSKAERRAFKALISAQFEYAGDVTEAQIGLISDCISARSRVSALEHALRNEQSAEAPDRRLIMSLSRSIDATSAKARLLAEEIERSTR